MRLSKSDDTVAIGQRLEEIRKNLGYSQRMMAEELDETVQQYQKYIKGENALSANRINYLYRHTQIDVRYLITGEREEDNKTFTFVLSTYRGRNRKRFLDSMWMYLQKITGMDEAYLRGKNNAKSDESIYMDLDIPRSTYFKKKKDAIVLFGMLMLSYAKRREKEDMESGLLDE